MVAPPAGWLASLRFADRASQSTIADYLHAHDVLIARRDRIEAELATLADESPCKDTVGRLRCLRGIDMLSALGLCAEIGEWDRFDHPDQLASYIGIVPCEHTSGQQRRQDAITKAPEPIREYPSARDHHIPRPRLAMPHRDLPAGLPQIPLADLPGSLSGSRRRADLAGTPTSKSSV